MWDHGEGGGGVCLRRGICITQDVPVLEILGVGTHLQVFFEGFLALDGGEGRLVDGGGGGFVCHVYGWRSRGLCWKWLSV